MRFCSTKKYTPFSLSFQGNMQVLVTYGGDPIPKSPFTVGVAAPLDLSKIKINGLENSKCVMRPLAASTCWRLLSLGSLQNMRFCLSVLERCHSEQSWT